MELIKFYTIKIILPIILILTPNLLADTYSLETHNENNNLHLTTEAKEVTFGAVELNESTEKVLKSIPSNIALFTDGKNFVNFLDTSLDEVHSFPISKDKLNFSKINKGYNLKVDSLEEGTYLVFAYSKDEAISYPFVYLNFNLLIEEKAHFPLLSAFIISISNDYSTKRIEIENVNYLAASSVKESKLALAFDEFSSSIYGSLFYLSINDTLISDKFNNLIETIEYYQKEFKSDELKEFRKYVIKVAKLLADIDVNDKLKVEYLTNSIFLAYNKLLSLSFKKVEDPKIEIPDDKIKINPIKKKNRNKRNQRVCKISPLKIVNPKPQATIRRSNVNFVTKRVPKEYSAYFSVFSLPKSNNKILIKQKFRGRLNYVLNDLPNGVYRAVFWLTNKKGTCKRVSRVNFIVKAKSDNSSDNDKNDDQCKEDPNKKFPGLCGCGVSDVDTDGDGTPDCNDSCVNDYEKLVPGVCGCGTSDIDIDNDGKANCIDVCPMDPNKKDDPGKCGCGVAEIDLDGDGTPDCNDFCEKDPLKVTADVCGCGVAETDSDNDGLEDCQDKCPYNPKLKEPGVCGCKDVLSSGVCEDNCPNNPDKFDPGVCGCDVADTDTDFDGTPDCKDNCPKSSLKTEPGTCGCNFEDKDSDGDGTLDCEDECPNDIEKILFGACGCGNSDADSDKDGVADCNDNCPDDSGKTEAGTCGCGTPDDDSDGDGTLDCVDACPEDPEKIEPKTCGCGVAETDSDSDGTLDCEDACPNDKEKIEVGECGCGVAETDTDNDGTPDCVDPCPNEVECSDSDGDGISDVEEGIDTDTDEDGIPDYLENNDADTDGDGIPNNKDLDDDGDGINTIDECPTIPCSDADGDKIPDYLEPNNLDTDGDGLPDPADPDDDNDGKLTSEECSEKESYQICLDTDKDKIPDHLDKGSDFNENGISDTEECSEGYPCPDNDGDLVPNYSDECPDDENKFKKGICGCGVEETDTDNDGTPDCVDECKDDDDKVDGGVCGCGNSDKDTDEDGTSDCIDKCPNDKNKIDPGACGCKETDEDSDDDSVADCNDGCEQDSNKTEPGICGCGVLDSDSDLDGVVDCNDGCPEDGAKTEPGTCGCGTPDNDSDGDGTLDCNDSCEEDPNKTEPGVCGCGTSDDDSDSDGTLDCNDSCEEDPNKTEPGACGCGTPDNDSDDDGTFDCSDNCKNDPNKTEPGGCGCGIEDKFDEDGNPACEDLCPGDPNKTEPGVCDCGNEELDGNNDGIIDCGEDQTANLASNKSVFEGNSVYRTDVEAAKKIEEALGDLAESFNALAKDYVLEKGVGINFLVNVACIATNEAIDPFFANFISDEDIERTEHLVNRELPLEVFSGNLPEAMTVEQLREKVKNEECVEGITDNFETNAMKVVTEGFNDPSYENQNHLEDINFEDAYQFFRAEGRKRVVVATIDTGYDMEKTDGTTFSDILQGSNIAEQFDPIGESGDYPHDTMGHGTMVGSIIAAAENNSNRTVGIAAKQVKLLPIKFFRQGSLSNATLRLFHSIRYAVNAGAKVVNISLGGASEVFCDPVIGQAIYLAIEKGVFFVFSAGNGYPDRNGVLYPIELKGPTDDGPQDFGRTISPACWGEYFKGAVTVAALNTGTKELAEFSNYGHPVEMAAPGTGILANGIDGAVATSSGTSFSAPQVAAAAALIMSVAKTNNWFISPWLLEDMLLNGSPVADELTSVINDGKYLDLSVLKDYVAELKAMTPEERRRIPSKNQRADDGWDPEKDIEDIEKITIDSPVSTIKVGDEVQLKAHLLFKDGRALDITEHERVFWTAQYQINGKTTMQSKTGLFKLVQELPEGASTVRILVHFGDYEGEFNFQYLKGDKGVLEELIFDIPEEIEWGKNLYFRVDGKYTTSSGGERILDVTEDVNVVSNIPSELSTHPQIVGYFPTKTTYGDKTYTVTATLDGKSVSKQVKILPFSMKLWVRNALGNPFRGQYVRLRSVIEAEDFSYVLPTKATWESLTEGLTLQTNESSEVIIPTEPLELGDYTVRATAPFRGLGENATLTTVYTFTVKNSYDRLSLVTKTPIINYLYRAIFSLRFFTSNNSYKVIHPSKIAWSTSDPALPIDNQGIVYPTYESLNNGKGKTYTVYADYLGSRISSQIRIVPVSVISGQAAKVSHIVIEPRVQPADCRANSQGVCEQVLLSSAKRGIWYNVDAYYTDGNKRRVTGFSSISSSHPEKLTAYTNMNFIRLQPPSRPNENYVITALYEGYQADFPVNVIATKKVEYLHARVDDPITSDNPTFLPSDLIRTTDTRPMRELEYFFRYEDDMGRVLSRYEYSSKFGDLIADDSTYSNSFESYRNQLLISNMPYDQVIDFKYKLHHTDFGFIKDFTVPNKIEKYTVEPNNLFIDPSNRSSEHSLVNMFIEKQMAHRCSLGYETGEAVPTACQNLNVSLSYENSNEEVRGVGYRASNNNLLYMAYDKFNINKTVVADYYHKDYPHLTAKLKIENLNGIDYFPEHPYVKKDVPEFNESAKEKDPYCTDEKVAARPVAGGLGTKEDPLLICSLEQLFELSNMRDWDYVYRYNQDDLRYYVKLLDNLDFSDVDAQKPITADRISLEGNGYRLSNFTIIDRENSSIALFRDLHGIRNLTVVNPTIRGLHKTAAITARLNIGSTVENVVVKGGVIQGSSTVGAIAANVVGGVETNLSGKGHTTDRVLVSGTKINVENSVAGCLYGKFRGRMTNSACETDINFVGVQGTSGRLGGLVGEAKGNIHITDTGDVREPIFDDERNEFIFNSTFSGEINSGLSVGGVVIGGSTVGGLVGMGEIPILDSKSSALIVSPGSGVGGLIGFHGRYCSRFNYKCLIYNSEFDGSIIGGKDFHGASSSGGLIGYGTGGMIYNSRSNAQVIRGVSHIGSTIGLIGNGLYRVHNSSADTEVTSSREVHGGFVGYIEDETFRFDNEPHFVLLENIFGNNTWKLKDAREDVNDVGQWRKRYEDGSELLRNVDTEGIDQVN